MNFGKLVSGLIALLIYLALIFVVLYFYNIHQVKAKNYVEKNSNRVTVTLVNSDKTVLNRTDKVSIPKKPLKPIPPLVPKKVVSKKTPKKVVPKKVVPKKVTPSKVIPKKRVPKKVVPKKRVPKKVVPKRVVPKKKVPKKVIPKKVVPKKIAPKKRVPKKVVPKKVVPKKKVPKRVVPKKVIPKKPVPKIVVPKKRVPKKTAKDLFSSVKSSSVKRTPVKRVPKPPVIRQPSRIKHNSSFADRTRATHQSGRVANANRKKGDENRYKAHVEQYMNDWVANGHKGQRVTIKLTVYQSGKFKYRVVSGVDGSMKNSLRRHLDTLNRMGLGRHQSKTPHTFTVHFKIRQ